MSRSVLRMQHSSLQFSDSDRQQHHDVQKIFKKGYRFPIKTGTEAVAGAGDGNRNREFLKKFAEEHNHVISFATDTWVAVDRRIIKPMTVSRDSVFLADNDEMVGRGANRAMATISFTHKNEKLGRFHVGSVHYPLKGARPGDPNYELNKKVAAKIGDWLRDNARGSDIGLLGGDFNLNDRLYDWSYDGNFTSLADQLGVWKNTGHGPIDGFASYNRDRRISPKAMKVFPDKTFFLHSDHYLCRGFWYVEHLKR